VIGLILLEAAFVLFNLWWIALTGHVDRLKLIASVSMTLLVTLVVAVGIFIGRVSSRRRPIAKVDR
jgi:hypothetical protein